MRILVGYNYFPHPVDVKNRVESRLARLKSYGFNVDSFPLNPSPPEHAFSWSELDALWRRGDRGLLRLYEALASRLESYDVFLNINGINLHPDMVSQLPAVTVYSCFDDPESSEILSKPVAAAYDVAMVGNIACLDSYREWGVQHVHWWPIGFQGYDCDPSLTREKILSGERDIPVTLLCERLSTWRNRRIETFVESFPSGAYYGRGWPTGFLSEGERVPIYQRTRIGPNFHNSTGPVNSRTFVLPANGVMQLCDNKHYLGGIFEVGKEVVGFDSVEEAIDLCRYYLTHDLERREIAAAGWERAHRDYNEQAVFKRLIDAVAPLVSGISTPKKSEAVITICRQQRSQTRFSRYVYKLSQFYLMGRSMVLNQLRRIL